MGWQVSPWGPSFMNAAWWLTEYSVCAQDSYCVLVFCASPFAVIISSSLSSCSITPHAESYTLREWVCRKYVLAFCASAVYFAESWSISAGWNFIWHSSCHTALLMHAQCSQPECPLLFPAPKTNGVRPDSQQLWSVLMALLPPPSVRVCETPNREVTMRAFTILN